MRHVIKKQVIELRLSGGSEDMFRLQQKASQYYYRSILPLLEKIFDSISPGSDSIQIDRLEIDLGLIQWDKEVQEIIINDLHIVLKEETEKMISELPLQQFLQKQDGKQPRIRKESASQNAARQWIYYMTNGVVPWAVTTIDEEWKGLVLEGLATDYNLAADLKDMITHIQAALNRITREHTESFLVALLELISTKEQKIMPQLVAEIMRIQYPGQVADESLPGKPVTEHSKPVWRYLLKKAAASTANSLPMQLSAEWIKSAVKDQTISETTLSELQYQLPLLGTAIIDILQEIKTRPGGSATDNSRNDNRIPDQKLIQSLIIKKTNEIKENTRERTGDKDIPEAGENLELPGQPIRSEASEERVVAADNSGILEEGIYVGNAGLVLLHPFFRFLFLHRNLTTEGKFINKAAQEKAIHLLHYIATGSLEAEEHILAMPKLLCGWALEEPVQLDGGLSAQDRADADDLVNAALAQWTILKNTSTDGLREGFLHRKGKMFLKNGDIHIIMETNAIDILLDHLPWNLSIIKLPWLDQLIRVEWR
jgi:hypothetical protein